MTGEQFQQWIEEMKAAKIVRFQSEIADKLGVSENTISEMKLRGCDKRTALACRALLHRLEPYE